MPKTEEQAFMLANRLAKRFKHLKKWAKRTGTEAFRLYDRDIPEIPLVLDFYGSAETPQQAALAGALYKRPYEKDEAEEERWLAAMREAAAGALGVEAVNIFLKRRQRQRGLAQYEKNGSRRMVREVREGGLRFTVNLSDYLDTGLFPDRRMLRAIIRGAAAGKRVLNLFAYTGSFSVYAAAGGAASTDSVDLSNTYLHMAADNFAHNGFTAELVRPESLSRGGVKTAHRLIRADALAFIERAAGWKWDIIILDPPAFSNSKKMQGTLDLRRDCIDLASRCLCLLEKGGSLYLSANARGMKLDAAETEAALAPRFLGVKVTDIGGSIIDEDFKGRKMPATLVFNN